MRTIWNSLLHFCLLGVCFGSIVVSAQIQNPTYAILSLSQYRAYFGFYLQGGQLNDLSRFAVLCGFLILGNFLFTTLSRLGLGKFFWYSARGEVFSWPWRSLCLTSALLLGVFCQLSVLGLVACDLLMNEFGALHHMTLLSLPLVPLIAAVGTQRKVSEHKLLRGVMAFLSLNGFVWLFGSFDIIEQLEGSNFLVPPMLSTHYGPLGLLIWSVAKFACLGLTLGAVFCALEIRPDAEPDSLSPRVKGSGLRAALIFAALCILLPLAYFVHFVPRYHLGLDLRHLLTIQEQQKVAPRTVVFLDSHDEAHHLEAQMTWSHPGALQSLKDWMMSAPSPSALTRPASKILADEALWRWQPDEALDWLEVHRRRLTHSNLNRAFLQAVELCAPSPERAKHLDALLNEERFAWPGAGSRLELATQLQRYGRDEEALTWNKSAQDLGAENLRPPEVSPSDASLQGRLFLNGVPLEGARIALFHAQEEQELLTKTRSHIASESDLLNQSWTPKHYQYLDFQKLLNFYAVGETDQEGYFLFEDLEPGLYRLAVRLPEHAQLEQQRELITLSSGEERELESYRLKSGPILKEP